MNSFNHYAYGAIGDWMYRVVAGLTDDPSQPGYKHIVVRPQPGGALTYAKATLVTPYGEAASGWKLDGDRLMVTAIVPPNTQARCISPVRGSNRCARAVRPLRRRWVCADRRSRAIRSWSRWGRGATRSATTRRRWRRDSELRSSGRCQSPPPVVGWRDDHHRARAPELVGLGERRAQRVPAARAPGTLRKLTPFAPRAARCRRTKSTIAAVGADVASVASARSASCASAARRPLGDPPVVVDDDHARRRGRRSVVSLGATSARRATRAASTSAARRNARATWGAIRRRNATSCSPNARDRRSRSARNTPPGSSPSAEGGAQLDGRSRRCASTSVIPADDGRVSTTRPERARSIVRSTSVTDIRGLDQVPHSILVEHVARPRDHRAGRYVDVDRAEVGRLGWNQPSHASRELDAKGHGIESPRHTRA